MLEGSILSILWSAGAFIVALGVLVAFHEYGHFWVARRLGVKVLRYSIGFGKPLWRRVGQDGVEYVIAAIPLGGYVKMLDEREGDVPEAEAHRAFNRASVYRRIAIVSAGPLANFLFAIVAYWLVFVVGTTALRPVIDAVPPQTIAHEAGLRGGEVVTALDGQAIESWDALRPALIEAALSKGPVPVSVTEDGLERQFVLDFSGASADPQTLFPALGLNPVRPRIPAQIESVTPDSPAARAGVQAGDVVLAVDEVALNSWRDFQAWVSARPDQAVQLQVQRGDRREVLDLTIGAAEQGGATIGRIGVTVAIPEDLPPADTVTVRRGPLAAIPAALDQTWTMSALTVRMLGRMVVGDVSLKNISGPIHIAEYAGRTAEIGLVTFLSFMAIISVSLGVLNLLPVPVLDGGHLLYYLIEMLKGSPVSEHTQVVGQQVGLLLLFMLMSLAFYNDISRLIG